MESQHHFEWVNQLSGWWFQTWLLFSISYMGCHPLPIDELHHFSRWLLHHQPDYKFTVFHHL